MIYRSEQRGWKHTEQPTERAGPPPEEADVAMILLHGRGASAQGMLQLADAVGIKGVSWQALQAEENTWYPLSFMAPREQNQPGLDEGLLSIRQNIDQLNEQGVDSDRIGLLGFSQGACLASEFAARHPKFIKTLMALSGGLIGEKLDEDIYAADMNNLEVFMGCSDRDPHVPLQRVRDSVELMEKRGATVDSRIYPGMGHTVNKDELEAVKELIEKLKGG